MLGRGRGRSRDASRRAERPPRIARTVFAVAGRGISYTGAMALARVGRYEVTGKPSPDAGGIRYPAFDTLLLRDVYVRSLTPSLWRDEKVREHFLLQARHAARLRHPNIAGLLDVVEHEGRVYQVLPREQGMNLDLLVRKTRGLAVDEALGIALGLCDGLAYAHAEEVVHGCPRPEVVFLDAEGSPVLHGFEPVTEFADPVLRVGMVVGNARFLAPEAVRREARDCRSDLWSLGAMLWHMLAACYPQSRRDAVGVMEQTVDPRPFRPLSELRPGLPARVTALVARLLEKERDRRPASAEEVGAAIEILLVEGEAPAAGDRTVRLLGGGAGGLRRFAILERLGRGAFGVVFRARERGSGRQVALKILRPDLTEDDRLVARFRREAEAARGLDHPGIVRVYDAGRDGDAHFVVMEYVEGPTLAERVRKPGGLPAGEAAPIARGIAEALAHAHARQVVHRDLKPGNILLRGGREPVLVDFGIAHLGGATRLTQTGEMLGTPCYMAPEQLEGRAADEQADLYSLGAVIYEMLAGAPPYRAESLPALVRLVAEGTPPPLGPEVPEALARLALRLLSRDPAARGAGAAAVAAELAG